MSSHVPVVPLGGISRTLLPAYDQVIYVGEDQVAGEGQKKQNIMKVVATGLAAPTSALSKIGSMKEPTPVQVATKKSDAKKVAKKTTGAVIKSVTTHKTIVSALPNLQAGQWLPLAEVAKLLHDKKLLAKSATSTKLFRKFPEHFELLPAGKPNKVRLITA